MTKVVEFPVKAPAGIVKADVTAIQQLENYLMFMKHYVDHNCSITVHVRDNEWEEVEDWVWDHWDDIVALSFLSYDNSFYELLPYEEISQEEYEKRKAAMRPFNPSILTKYEYEETDLDIDYPEYDIEQVTENRALNMLEEVKKDLNNLKNTFDNGKIIKEGIKQQL